MVITVQQSNTSLHKVLQSLKAHTARTANKILNRQGAFWLHESYDHVVRSEKELERIVWNVLHNPVKATLDKEWQDWPWSYCRPDIGDPFASQLLPIDKLRNN
jgi:putative transposase